ncbi:MAG: hypothetical protein K6F57_04940 [Candidatus Saccharibacteria bacterium]|nr:hypothetical protein [Candidatus Saccharibacteria bacterium]
MPEPKKQSSPRKTGLRRSHLRLKLARSVNKHSPVKAFETAKKTPNLKLKTCKCGKKNCDCKDCNCKNCKAKKDSKKK